MWLWIVGGGALLTGGAIAIASSKKVDKAAAAATPGAPPNLPYVTATIQPAGISQPPGIVSLPAPASESPALTAAARALLTYFNTNTPGKGSVPQVKAFQTQYNMSGPTTPLKPDGIYGPKCQAALQSVVGLAPVPGHVLPIPVMAAPPSIPAAKPVTGVDVTGAASILASMVGQGLTGSFFPKTSDKRVSTFQAAYNAVPGVLHLPVDGKYGATTQAALQLTLNYMGGGLQAPDNPFSGSPKSIPVYPAPDSSQLQALSAAHAVDLAT